MAKSGYSYLGIPYWDWTEDRTIPTLFDDLTFPTLLDQAKKYHDMGQLKEWYGRQEMKNGDFLMKDWRGRLINWTKKVNDSWISCKNGLRIRESPLLHGNRPIRPSLKDRVDDVLEEQNMIRFSQRLSDVHGPIHVYLRCRMAHLESAAYDPVFWMHHAFVDKVFAIWQDQNPHLRERRGKFMEPFHLDNVNHFKDFTNLLSNDTWDYKEKLCSEYDYLLPPVLGDGHGGNLGQHDNKTTGYVVTSYVAIVLPNNIGGELQFKHCNSENVCQEGDLAVFGSGGAVAEIDDWQVDEEHFTLHTKLFMKNVQIINNNGGLQLATPSEMKWMNLSISGELRDEVPKSAPPMMLFKITDLKTKASRELVHLPIGGSRRGYGDLLDEYDVTEYCGKFQIEDHESFAVKTGYWLDWQLGHDQDCKQPQ